MVFTLRSSLFNLALLASLPVSASSYFRVAQLFDGSRWISPAYIHIEEDMITYLSNSPQSANQTYTNLDKSTLLPPLVDAHQHLSITDPNYGDDYEQAFLYSYKLPQAQKTRIGLSTLNDYLHKGFLYIRDLGGDQSTLDAIKEKIHDLDYPYIQWSSLPIAAKHGQCPSELPCRNYFQAPEHFKHNKGETLKIYLDNEPFPGKLDLPETTSILSKVSDLVAFHSIYPYPLEKLADKLNRDDSLEHIHSITKDQLDALVSTHVRLVPTDLPESFIESYRGKISPWPYEEVRIQAKRAQLLAPYKDQICFGSDFYIDPHDPIRTRAFWALEGFLQQAKRLKLTPTQALKTITSQCAPLFSNAPNLGELKVGAQANLIIVDGNLTHDLSKLHNIQWVFKKGKVLVRP